MTPEDRVVPSLHRQAVGHLCTTDRPSCLTGTTYALSIFFLSPAHTHHTTPPQVADIWRPKQAAQSFAGEHSCFFDGDFEATPELIASRPLLEDIYRHRLLENGVAVALERWEQAKTGRKEGVFDDAVLHRAGFYVLDVMAEQKDLDGGELIYSELHDTKVGMGSALAFDATHLEKMVLLCHRAEAYSKGISYMEEAIMMGAGDKIKTQTYALAMGCCGRELEAAKGIDLWKKWVFLEREVASFPYFPLAELAMGAIDDADVAEVELILRHFNDFYLEQVWDACRKTGMDNDQMVYYTEWLFKSRRHVMLNPERNLHFMKYALNRNVGKFQ